MEKCKKCFIHQKYFSAAVKLAYSPPFCCYVKATSSGRECGLPNGGCHGTIKYWTPNNERCKNIVRIPI